MKRIFTLGALLGTVVICSGTMTAITLVQADTREYTYTIQDAHNLQDFPLAKPTTEDLTGKPEIMHELVDKIIVHEPDKSSGKRVQDIEIHFRFDVTVSTISVETGKYEKKRSHNRRCYATTLRKKKLLYHYCAFVYALKYSRTASKLSIFLYTIDNISSVSAIRSGTIIGIIFAL